MTAPDDDVAAQRGEPETVDPDVEAAREALLATFAWDAGHADVWATFRDAAALAAVVRGLAAPFRDGGCDVVAAVEARGFLLGAAVAIELGLGFVAVRKAGALFPGDKVTVTTGEDYRGEVTELLLQRAALRPGDRVLLVDDWIETGAQARAVAEAVAACEAELVAITVMVDQLAHGAQLALPQVTGLVTASQLPAVPAATLPPA